MREWLSRDAVIAHPFRAGWMWAVLAIPLTFALLLAMGIRDFEWRQVPRIALLIVVAGPLFGLMLRWAYERDEADARR